MRLRRITLSHGFAGGTGRHRFWSLWSLNWAISGFGSASPHSKADSHTKLHVPSNTLRSTGAQPKCAPWDTMLPASSLTAASQCVTASGVSTVGPPEADKFAAPNSFSSSCAPHCPLYPSCLVSAILIASDATVGPSLILLTIAMHWEFAFLPYLMPTFLATVS
jgi:hypothetical protein